MEQLSLGSVTDYDEGQAKGFDLNQQGKDTFFIVRKEGKIYAYTDICPHYGDTSLPWKRHQYLDSENQYIVCAAHGALFEIKNGRCVRGPCKGQALKKISVEVSSDNRIWISLATIEEFKL